MLTTYMILKDMINGVAPNSVYRNWRNEIYTHSKKEPKIFVWKQRKVAKLEKYDFNDFFFIDECRIIIKIEWHWL